MEGEGSGPVAVQAPPGAPGGTAAGDATVTAARTSAVEKVKLALTAYLHEVVPPLLGCSRNELTQALSRKDKVTGSAGDTIKRFLVDGQVKVLIVGRKQEKNDVEKKDANKKKAGKHAKDFASSEDELAEVSYYTFISTEIDREALNATSLAFLKRPVANLLDIVDDDDSVVSVADKLQVINIGFLEEAAVEEGSGVSTAWGSTFETLSNYLQYCIDPIISAQESLVSPVSQAPLGLSPSPGTQEGEEGSVAARNNLSAVRKKLTELLVSVQQAQQNVQIPFVTLQIEPVVAEAVARARSGNEKADPAKLIAQQPDQTLFLNQLQSGVNKWMREIQRIVRLDRDPASGNATEEVNFWSGMEKSLYHVEQQLEAAEVELTLGMLKASKRFFATVSFEQDTGLKARMEQVTAVNALMRDLPLNDLLSASSLEQINAALRTIFGYLRKLKNVSHYPLQRALGFFEALSKDLNAQLLKVLPGTRLMHLPMEEFESVVSGTHMIAKTWNDEVRKFKEMARDQMKMRGSLNLLRKLTLEHAALLERLEDICRVRRDHQKLSDVLTHVLSSSRSTDNSAHRDIIRAYRFFLTVDALDVTRTGQDAWAAAKKAYDERIDKVESQITSRLRDKLGAARTGTEMFYVFAQFNVLFLRPRIRSAIQEYQSTLIKQVKDDIKVLQIKFTQQYPTSSSAVVCRLRDIPPMTGSLIWSRQLERQWQVALKRVADVLGKDWDRNMEGLKLKQSGEEFSRRLNIVGVYEGWLKEVKEWKKVEVNAKVLCIRKLGGVGLEMDVSYDPQSLYIFREVKHLQAMQFEQNETRYLRIPYSVKVAADEAKIMYPTCMWLEEAVRTYSHTMLMLQSDPLKKLSPLVANCVKDVHEQLEFGTSLRWEDEVEPFVVKLCNLVYLMEAKVEDLEAQTMVAFDEVEKLRTLPLTHDGEAFRQSIGKVQKIVEELYLANYTNLSEFTQRLNEKLGSILSQRLNELVDLWVEEFEVWPENGTNLIKNGSFHEFRVQSQLMYLLPPVEAARQHWVGEFHRAVGTLCCLPKITPIISMEATRGGGNDDDKDGKAFVEDVAVSRQPKDDFRYLMNDLDLEKLRRVFHAVDALLSKLEAYVSDWLKYQYLWDVEASYVVARVQNSLESWQQLLNEIRASRATFDTSEDRKSFGPVVVDYSTVQSKITIKFDAWHREILSVFGAKVSEQVSNFSSQMKQIKGELDRFSEPSQTSFLQEAESRQTPEENAATTEKVSAFVLLLEKARQKEKEWAPQVEHFRLSEKLLERQRFAFPSTWIWVDGVVNGWEEFQQLLHYLSSLLERHRSHLQGLVLQQDSTIQESLTQLYSEWARSRPVQGDTQPTTALAVLSKVESKLSQLRQSYDKLSQAKLALDMQPADLGRETGGLTPEVLEEEVSSLRGVWMELQGLYTSLDVLKDTPWSAVVPKKVRQSLSDLQAQVKKIPAKFRQYEAFEQVQSRLNDYLQMNMLLSEMKTNALKERHWKQISEVLQLRVPVSDLTLGHLWDANLPRYEQSLREILTQAQGEMALEEFLKQVKEDWSSYSLDLVLFKNKCKLIRGWDDLFAKLDEHLNSLQSMRMSPYFKIFEEEAAAWDERLNRIRVLFDSWMEVQRKWVYLEGVFTGSADIQTLLPNEYARFGGIDNDFRAIMKKTTASPKILEVAASEGLQRSLDRLSDLLSKIQKALGEYLERQRLEFPRFYFVGDEDLLEMIGNSRDVKIVQRHLNKMFAGIASFVTDDEDPGIIVAIGSKEGEVVKLIEPIQISAHKALNAWLRACERSMFLTIADLLGSATERLRAMDLSAPNADVNAFFDWVAAYPAQVVMMSVQIDWTSRVEAAFKNGRGMEQVVDHCEKVLGHLADRVLLDSEKLVLLKYVQLITEIVHQRGVARDLKNKKVASSRSFEWLQYMRFYWNSREKEPLQRLDIRMANASFRYGFEYLGITEKLVQTPLTDKCYLTLTQALHMRLGGNPFGPAGTGKTETVKALGAQLGRFVLVFCCDEAFDFQAMGRIFVGLCQVGAWGCFDEFNRLEERILSAVSEQILTIQLGLKAGKKEIELLNKQVLLNPDMGIFVTMNPGYAGRSNLPDNLKQLFREFAMINPDKVLITEVLLYSRGFQTAERLSSKIVALFDLCLQQLSKQPHYDFGLRSLKSVLASAGNLKRAMLQEKAVGVDHFSDKKTAEEAEQKLLLRSVCDTVVPKLVAQDVPLLQSLLSGVFPGAGIVSAEEAMLEDAVRQLCVVRHLQPRPAWLEKTLQLYHIQRLHHGVMMVGPVGTGKSEAWRILLDAMELVDGVKGFSYVLDAKAVPKEQLYGRLDPTTLEWTDGVFTALLRKILYSSPGAGSKRHWIVFDGDVDPEWAENLNSVLDDNKLLTLPNGERLQIPPNVRIMFEVDSLKSATLATVSRCGMVWFSQDVLPEDSVFHRMLSDIRVGEVDDVFAPGLQTAPSRLLSRHRVSFDRLDTSTRLQAPRPTELTRILEESALEEGGPTAFLGSAMNVTAAATQFGGTLAVHGKNDKEAKLRNMCVDALLPFFDAGGFASKCIQRASELSHVMNFTRIRVTESLFSLLRKAVSQLVEFSDLVHSDKSISLEHVEKFMTKSLLFSICWGCGGSMSLAVRVQFCQDVAQMCSGVPLPEGLDSETTLLDFEVCVEDGAWRHWRERVASVEIEPKQVQDANVVIETMDTIRHRHVLSAWLEEKKPFILCGPPGSGKTMTLSSTLKGLSDFDIASLNFSSGTTPQLLLKTFDHYCEYVKTPSGIVLRPSQPGKWLIVFADEINLPEPNAYGTQRVIMFMRQMQEYNGFWKPVDQSGNWAWVKIERIQFAGACNPPTDAGRHEMSDRFLRHAPLMFVDFPGPESLRQIYGTFNRAMLRPIPSLRGYATNLTNAMVDFYRASQTRFTVDLQPHYIYSPRELTRWKVALYEALQGRDHVDIREFVRLHVHEGLRIFQDRLVEQAEREWTDETIDKITLSHFAPAATKNMLERPILFCCCMTKFYDEVPREELRELIQSKLKVFNEEELNVPLVLFDQVLDHITRIDRVLRQPLGHLLLVGASGAGKTVLSKFVSWLNGLSVFQIKAGRNYDTSSFEADLRVVMKRAGLKEEKVTFIFDESNALGPAFLERMNALLASGEVPGLFEGDEYAQLISECKASYGADTAMDEQDLFARFTREVQRNLHIVFTMNPANPDFANRQATSPALFNRCVIDWFGDWPHEALQQVAKEFTASSELPSDGFTGASMSDEARREAVSTAIVTIHESVAELNARLAKVGKKFNYLTPRDYLDFIRHFIALSEEKRGETAESTKHLHIGLAKLKETEQQVAELSSSLALKETQLQEKNKQAEEKMVLMVQQQAEAEGRKKQAEELARDLDVQATTIAERRGAVEKQLKAVEPKLKEAEAAVANIPKRNLDELRALANPPAAVKFAVEAVVVMLNNLGNAATSWEDCRRVLKGGDFINRVLQFDSNKTSPQTVHRINLKYLKCAEWNLEKITRASKAAGPLAKWVESSISYQEIIQEVDPLRAEIEELEAAQSQNKRKLDKTQAQIAKLEEELAQYKAEYAQLISDVQFIKKEMDTVQKKVQRSSQLLRNLASEKIRWSAASEASKDQLRTSTGDNLLAGAFCTYMGFFEHAHRSKLIVEWMAVLDECCVRCRPDLSFVEFLSKPSDRLAWVANALPSDDLSVENAIVLSRYIRYPLVIDPSGQATAFLSNQFAARKIIKTSFVDATFFKNLESSLRFGTPLLVQDVEKVDPILNSVLNQETHKAGGRVLITVGDSEIDFSPSFTMFLTTRDPTAQFTPDLCSRVTFVNFTLTPSSLLNQCLNLVLKSERSDVDKKRSDLLKLQGEFKVKIRELEESLLLALSNVTGNILDDDKVISTLETLKAQAAQVAEEAAGADQVIAEVEKVSEQYLPLAQAAARVYFTLQYLHSLSYLYHYDLNFFENIFHYTLRDKATLSKVKSDDYAGRLKVLVELFFKNVYSRCAVGLFYEDRLSLALQLARIRFESEYEVQFGGADLEFFLRGEITRVQSPSEKLLSKSQSSLKTRIALPKEIEQALSADQIKFVHSLKIVPAFADLGAQIKKDPKAWVEFLVAPKPEDAVPDLCLRPTTGDQAEETAWASLGLTEKQQQQQRRIRQLTRKALILKAMRPDRLPIVLAELVECVCGTEFLNIHEFSQDEMQDVILKQVKSSVPLMLVSVPGFDPSFKLLNLAKTLQRHVTSIAMGSEEGYGMAEKAIAAAARQGEWVLLKNVHLATSWLHELEKRLFRMHLHENFRLFLAMEQSPKVPTNLLRVSYTIVFEPPAGIRASMQRTYAQILNEQRTERQPVAARCRLYFLLAFLHALVLERKRYVPIGWSKPYEFSDADQLCALEVVDEWLDAAATGSAVPGSTVPAESLLPTIDPSKISFQAIRTLLKDAVYGGRLDNDVDFNILATFVDELFRPEAFESDFQLARGHEATTAPGDASVAPLLAPDLFRSREQYITWVDSLPLIDQPTWLGLAPKAERLLSIRHGMDTLNKWLALHSKSAEDLRDLLPTAVSHSSSPGGSSTVGSPPKLLSLKSKALLSRSLTRKGSGPVGWVAELLPRVDGFQRMLPMPLLTLPRSDAAVNNAMFRCFDREIATASGLLERIRLELADLREVCAGTQKFTNYTRELGRCMARGEVPKEWKSVYTSPKDISLTDWMSDFCCRIGQLSIIGGEFGGGFDPRDEVMQTYQQQVKRMVAGGRVSQNCVWFGGLLYPMAFITATRQTVAQKQRWSLDDLEVEVDIGMFGTQVDDQSFLLGGMFLESAAWDSKRKMLTLAGAITEGVPQLQLRWIPSKAEARKQRRVAQIPIFLTKARSDLVLSVGLQVPEDTPARVWAQRGVALIATA